jgi:uncharacterized protein with PIN domain
MIKHATFRFYEELNDFLPKHIRKVDFDYQFNGSPPVKDVIEAIGVPHVEVDLILINGESVDFKYILKSKDMVSVYPVFETLDITNVARLRPKPLRDTRFILDVHLGKLAKSFRLFGFDVAYRNDYDDRTIVQIALDEHRVILTRDIGLLKMKAVTHGYFIRNQNSIDQLKEVLEHFDIFNSIKPFSRCVKCNGKLKSVNKDAIIHLLKPLTIKYYNHFFQCSDCHGIFWKGSHYQRMKGFICTIIESK